MAKRHCQSETFLQELVLISSHSWQVIWLDLLQFTDSTTSSKNQLTHVARAIAKVFNSEPKYTNPLGRRVKPHLARISQFRAEP